MSPLLARFLVMVTCLIVLLILLHDTTRKVVALITFAVFVIATGSFLVLLAN